PSAVSLKLNSTKPTPLADPSVGNHRLLRFKTTASAVKPSRCSLHGSTALVTGGTRGIGHAIVEELAWLGATVHTCVRNEDELEKYLRAWEDEGLGVTGSVCDVSSQADRGKLLDSISSVFDGKLNILSVSSTSVHSQVGGGSGFLII
ncbi:hypothetical protein Pfo_031067, partial [Paulownia fortunei]